MYTWDKSTGFRKHVMWRARLSDSDFEDAFVCTHLTLPFLPLLPTKWLGERSRRTPGWIPEWWPWREEEAAGRSAPWSSRSRFPAPARRWGWPLTPQSPGCILSHTHTHKKEVDTKNMPWGPGRERLPVTTSVPFSSPMFMAHSVYLQNWSMVLTTLPGSPLVAFFCTALRTRCGRRESASQWYTCYSLIHALIHG